MTGYKNLKLKFEVKVRHCSDTFSILVYYEIINPSIVQPKSSIRFWNNSYFLSSQQFIKTFIFLSTNLCCFD